jgi:3-oxoadipate enol-lactonase
MPHVTRNGVSTYYETYGSGTPIVFIHPFSTSGYIWAFQVFAFARNHQCIVVDHRGHGRSDKPQQGYAISEIAADVLAVLDQLRVPKAVFVGNSIGGMITMQLNLDAPDRVIGNVIVSSGTNLGAGMPPEVGQAFQNDLKAAFGGLIDGALSARTKRERPEVVDMINSLFLVESNFPHYVFYASAGDPNGVFNWNITDRLKDIKKPTLILAGEEDQATPVAANQFLADGIPGAQIKILKDIGHFYEVEAPDAFNRELAQFLKQVAA